MIHHVSIPARDPERVARVLAELWGGYYGRFIGPVPDAWVAYKEDGAGSGIEVYPERTVFVPGERDSMCKISRGDAPHAVAFHALVSVRAGRESIERIGAREGWRTQHCWRGPEGQQLFELFEFWVENRIMLELVTEDMLGPYLRIAHGSAQRTLIAGRSAAGAP